MTDQAATLYHAPMTCSLVARMVAAEAGVPLTVKTLNLNSKEILDGGSLLDINPLGQVSTLVLESGELLTENTAVLMWLQSQANNSDFAIQPNDKNYFQLLRWIGFCATELHKQIFRVVFYREATDEVKDKIRGLAPQRFELLNQHLSQREYLVGDRFSAADAYLIWFFVLSGHAKLDASAYPHLQAYQQRILSRPLIKQLIAEDQQAYIDMDEQIIAS